MTYTEQQEYNKLPQGDREEYDYIKRKHPKWVHSQVMAKVSVNHTLDDRINDGGNVDVDDPTVVISILEEAKEFLVDMGIMIDAVFEIIDNTLEALGDLVYRGISYIGNKLSDLRDWLTN